MLLMFITGPSEEQVKPILLQIKFYFCQCLKGPRAFHVRNITKGAYYMYFI